MDVDENLRTLIEDNKPHCTNVHCQKRGEALAEILLEAIGSPHIAAFNYMEETRLNPDSGWTRPVYNLIHADGRNLKLGLTKLTTVQVFSKRARYTHCYPKELRQRLERFINPPTPSTPLAATP